MRRWFAEFKFARVTLNNVIPDGRPSTATLEGDVVTVKQLIEENWCFTHETIWGSVWVKTKNITKTFLKFGNCCHWIPHELKPPPRDKKGLVLNGAQRYCLITITVCNSNAVYDIVTEAKRGFIVSNQKKQQSCECEIRLKKLKKARNGGNKMIAFFYAQVPFTQPLLKIKDVLCWVVHHHLLTHCPRKSRQERIKKPDCFAPRLRFFAQNQHNKIIFSLQKSRSWLMWLILSST